MTTSLASQSPPHELERDLESFFRERIQKIGGMTLKLAPTVAGAPDRLVLLPGSVIVLVELKTSKGSTRDIQKIWHVRARQLGTHVHVLHGKKEIVSWINRYLDSRSS